MSAIWGYFPNYEIKDKDIIVEKLEQPYRKCKIDSIKTCVYKNMFMGFGNQYIGTFSEKDILPIIDEENGYIFTADCFLDNREEIIDFLNIKECEKYGDATIAYKLFLQCGKCFVKKMRGAFSVLIYEIKTQNVLLYTDQVSERCIYYEQNENGIVVSTLLKPILNLLGSKKRINYEYLEDTLSMVDLKPYLKPNYTPIEGVYKMVAGTYAIFTKSKVRIERYYSPFSAKKRNSKVTNGYEEIKSIYEHAAREMTRTYGNVGTTLSSGLDSAGVSTVLAKTLNENGRKINTYTFIPIPDYKSEEIRGRLIDESSLVKVIGQRYPNMNQTFIYDEKINAINTMDNFIAIFETPYKSMQNMPNFYECFSRASEDGCRVVFTGQYGNVTTSGMEFPNIAYHFLKRLNAVRFNQTISEFAKENHIAPKQVKKIFLDNVKWELKHYKFNHFKKNGENSNITIGEKVKRKKNSHKKLFNKDERFSFYDLNTYRKKIYDLMMLSLVGENMTKISLACGILIRDICKDIRIIDTCEKLPIDYFFKNGYGRAVVREGLKEYIPDEIRLNMSTKGLQSADNMFKLTVEWKKNFNIINENVDKLVERGIISADAWGKVREKIIKGPNKENEQDIVLAMYLTILSKCYLTFYQF